MAEPGTKPELRDYIALTKPGVTRMCMLTTAGAVFLAPGPVNGRLALATIVGAGLCVAAANALNMWWERGPDHLMTRTRKRPLPDGRITPRAAATFSAVLGIAALAILALGANLLSAGLAAFAFLVYVLAYTPLKYRTPLALLVGTIPGAVPPLIGWTAVTGELDAGGLALFAILVVWQIPHFLAISVYRKDEYERAGIRVVPVVRGVKVAKLQAIAWSLLLIPVSVMPTVVGIVGQPYFIAALVLGVAFFGWSVAGMFAREDARWARTFFVASLVYLPALTIALAVDVVL